MKTATDNLPDTCNSETAFVYLDEPIFGRTDTNDDGDITDEEDKSYYYTTNNLYSVAALLDPDGAIIERYEYLPYGKVTVYTDPGVDEEWFTADDVVADYSVVQPYTFTGQRSDPESGLMYFKNRYYSQELGRFVTRDPWETLEDQPLAADGYVDGMNLYNAYFIPDTVDPEGLSKRPPNTNIWVTGIERTEEAYAAALREAKQTPGTNPKYIKDLKACLKVLHRNKPQRIYSKLGFGGLLNVLQLFHGVVEDIDLVLRARCAGKTIMQQFWEDHSSDMYIITPLFIIPNPRFLDSQDPKMLSNSVA